MSALEIAAVAISFCGIWLTAKRSAWCWPTNLVACCLYFKVFMDVRLYADMALQGIFAMAMLYGWTAWLRGKEQSGEVVVEGLPRSQAIFGLVIASLGALAMGWGLSHYTDAALPWLDAPLSSFSLLAQFWTARRHSQSWLLWIALDTIYVGLFVFKGLWLTSGLYGAMVVLAITGYRRWQSAQIAE